MNSAPHPLAVQMGRALRLHLNIVQQQLEGITHADSLIQPPYGGNCLNWVIGHLVSNRAGFFRLAGLPLPWDAEAYARYARESAPLVDAAEALPLEQLCADYARATQIMLDWLAQAEPALLDATPPGEKSALGYRLSFLTWHETYHVGQLEQLRNLAGKHDKVI